MLDAEPELEPFDLNTMGRPRRAPLKRPSHAVTLGGLVNAGFLGSAVLLSVFAAYLSSDGMIAGLFLNSLTLWLLRFTLAVGWVVLVCLHFRSLSVVRDAPFLLTPVVGLAGMVFAATDIPFANRLQASEPELREFAEQCLKGRKDCPQRIGHMPAEKLYDHDVPGRVVTIITSEGYSQVRGVTYAPNGLPERYQWSGRPAYTHLGGPWYRFYIRDRNQ